MTALKLESLSKYYGKIQVLHDINLEVDDGEFVVFVGPSGCGKSTLLRVIAGLEAVTTGDVEIGGVNVNNVPPAKRGIAMVFQSYALYPHLNVRGNMTLALKQEKRSNAFIEERVKKASEMLDLSDYLHRFPSELSGGQRQRVAIARAIVREPKLFLFDEPLSNLDAALRMNTRLEIANLHRRLAASMIYVTHDQTEAMTLADKIVVINQGRVEQVGTPMELYNNPVNQFVAGFIGAPSMNFLPANLVYPGNESVLGIRPEDINIAADGPLEAHALHVEQLGGDTNIIVQLEGHQLTVRVFGQYAITPGDEIRLAFEQDKAFLFDETGQRTH